MESLTLLLQCSCTHARNAHDMDFEAELEKQTHAHTNCQVDSVNCICFQMFEIVTDFKRFEYEMIGVFISFLWSKNRKHCNLIGVIESS